MHPYSLTFLHIANVITYSVIIIFCVVIICDNYSAFATYFKIHIIFLIPYRAKKLQELEPGNGNVTLSLVVLHDKLGDQSKSTEYLEQVLECSPHHLPAYIALSQKYFSKII